MAARPFLGLRLMLGTAGVELKFPGKGLCDDGGLGALVPVVSAPPALAVLGGFPLLVVASFIVDLVDNGTWELETERSPATIFPPDCSGGGPCRDR